MATSSAPCILLMLKDCTQGMYVLLCMMIKEVAGMCVCGGGEGGGVSKN